MALYTTERTTFGLLSVVQLPTFWRVYSGRWQVLELALYNVCIEEPNIMASFRLRVSTPARSVAQNDPFWWAWCLTLTGLVAGFNYSRFLLAVDWVGANFSLTYQQQYSQLDMNTCKVGQGFYCHFFLI